MGSFTCVDTFVQELTLINTLIHIYMKNKLSVNLRHVHPRLQFADGGSADFAGKPGTIYNLFSTTNISFSMLSTKIVHMLPGPRILHDSIFNEAYVQLKTSRGKLVHIHFHANRSGFVVYSEKTLVCSKIGVWQEYTVHNIKVFFKQLTAYIRCCGWEINITRLPIFQPISGPRWKLRCSIDELRVRYFLKRNRKTHKKYLKYHKNRDIGIYPHGLLGQSFFSQNLSLSGRKLKYARNIIYNDIMSEGAIEGSASDYVIKDKFSYTFKFSRFIHNSLYSTPRNITLNTFSVRNPAEKRYAFTHEIWSKSFPTYRHYTSNILLRAGRNPHGT